MDDHSRSNNLEDSSKVADGVAPADEALAPAKSKKFAIAFTFCALAAILIAVDQFLGRRVLIFASGFAALLILRRDLLPTVPLADRLHLSLTVACGACLLLWLTLGGLGR